MVQIATRGYRSAQLKAGCHQGRLHPIVEEPSNLATGFFLANHQEQLLFKGKAKRLLCQLYLLPQAAFRNPDDCENQQCPYPHANCPGDQEGRDYLTRLPK
jgi:hypothetical protein